MGFGESISAGFANYFNFRTRATRSEYWYFILFLFIVSFALAIVEYVVSGPDAKFLLSSLFSLATFIPSLSVFVRRLHDIGRSGWWFFLGVIPLIGIIVLIYWLCQPSTPGPNEYGPAPA